MNSTVRTLLKFFVEEIRDEAINDADITLEFRNEEEPITKRWKTAFNTGDMKAFANVVVADTVDSVIFKVLNAIDSENLELFIEDSEGKIIGLSEIGKRELGGYYMVDAIKEFSKERKFNE